MDGSQLSGSFTSDQSLTITCGGGCGGHAGKASLALALSGITQNDSLEDTEVRAKEDLAESDGGGSAGPGLPSSLVRTDSLDRLIADADDWENGREVEGGPEKASVHGYELRTSVDDDSDDAVDVSVSFLPSPFFSVSSM